MVSQRCIVCKWKNITINLSLLTKGSYYRVVFNIFERGSLTQSITFFYFSPLSFSQLNTPPHYGKSPAVTHIPFFKLRVKWRHIGTSLPDQFTRPLFTTTEQTASSLKNFLSNWALHWTWNFNWSWLKRICIQSQSERLRLSGSKSQDK